VVLQTASLGVNRLGKILCFVYDKMADMDYLGLFTAPEGRRAWEKEFKGLV